MAKAKNTLADLAPAEAQALIEASKLDNVNRFKYKVMPIHPEAAGTDEAYIVDWTLQPREETDGSTLVEDIGRRGLLESPCMWVMPDGKLQLLQGHRRMHACLLLRTSKPALYDTLFPKGIPCKVYTEKSVLDENGKEGWCKLTEMDALALRADHDTDALRQQLSTKVEAIRLTKPLYQKGFTMRQVTMHTWRTVSRIFGGYDSLLSKLKGKEDVDYWKQIETTTHGAFQFLKRMAEAPDTLLDFYIKGQRGEGPVLATQKDYEDLSLIARKEIDADRNSTKPKMLSAEKPGPEFTAAFEEARKSKLKGAAKEAAKGLTKKAIEELKTRFQFVGFVMLTNCLLNDTVSLENLMETDSKAAAWYNAAQKDWETISQIVDYINVHGPLQDKEKDLLKKALIH